MEVLESAPIVEWRVVRRVRHHRPQFIATNETRRDLGARCHGVLERRRHSRQRVWLRSRPGAAQYAAWLPVGASRLRSDVSPGVAGGYNLVAGDMRVEECPRCCEGFARNRPAFELQ